MLNEKGDLDTKPVYGFTTAAGDRGTAAHQLSYTELWSGFKERTTAHGVSPIADARGNLLPRSKKIHLFFSLLVHYLV